MRHPHTGYSVKLAVWLFAGSLVIAGSTRFLVSQEASVQMTTEDRLLAPGWWPRKGSETRQRHVGSAACAACHARIVDIQKTSPMMSASMPAIGSVFGRSGITSPLSFSTATYRFEIALNAGGPAYSASDGTHSVSTSLGWAFGGGHFGQTYLYQQQGTFYESTLSYYPAIRGLDFTPGHTRSAPRSLAQALGEPQTLAPPPAPKPQQP
jgi:hypothetical protein